MSSGIFIIQEGDNLIELNEKDYDSEAILQSLLARHPSLLAGKQIDSNAPRRWLLISREMPIPLQEGGGGWMSLDHLFLDQDAIPTFVEVKRSSDTRIRREVVGQMLDYAANAVVYWPLEDVRARFEANCDSAGEDPDQTLSLFLSEERSIDEFWNLAQANLKAGKVRLLFVADVIPPELQRIVEFLNEQMNPAEVLAVEIKQYEGQGIQTLVPRIIGQTAEAQNVKRRTKKRNKWDENSFFAELENLHGVDVAKIAKKIHAWANDHVDRVWWGEGEIKGSFVPIIEINGKSHQLFAIWTNNRAEIYFHWYQKNSPFDNREKRMEMLNMLNDIPNVNLSEDGVDRLPSFPIAILDTNEKLEAFFDVFEWHISEVQKK